MGNLTSRQSEILNFIERSVKEQGYPPTVREIGKAVGLASSSTVHGYLDKLEEKGYIIRDPSKPRTIEILKRSSYSIIVEDLDRESANKLSEYLKTLGHNVHIK